VGSLLLRHRTTGRVPLASELVHTAIAESSNSDCEGAMERAIRRWTWLEVELRRERQERAARGKGETGRDSTSWAITRSAGSARRPPLGVKTGQRSARLESKSW
jgi:hypothetical protein